MRYYIILGISFADERKHVNVGTNGR